MLKKELVDEMLLNAKSHANDGDILESKRLYQAALQAKKELIFQELAALNKAQKNDARLEPSQEILNKLANLYKQEQHEAVVEQAKTLSKQYPHKFIIWNILGASTSQLGMHDQAINAYNKAISLKPDYAETYCNMSVTLQNLGKLDESVEACNKAIFLKHDYVVAYSNLGNTLQKQGKLNKAIEAYEKAISLKPNYADAYYNMGIALKDKGKIKEALETYNKAILINPNYALAYNNIGNILKDEGKLNEAIEAFNKVISLKPNYAEAHQNLGFIFLNSGRIKEGLDEYEWRWKIGERRQFLQPMWDGQQSLNDKRILIWSEQGVGDTIMWSSCLSLITSLAKHCILECQPKLLPLLKRSFPNVEVKTEDRSLDQQRNDFDFHLPMGSLYKNFIQEISRTSKTDAFLVPDPNRVDYWRKRLKSIGNGPYIGISWKSADMSPIRLPNYASILELSSVLQISHLNFVNLQYTEFADDLAQVQDKLGVTVHNFDDLDHFNNIDDVAALCSALDMVVSTKTTVPLISAAVGTSTKLANWKQSPWNNILLNPKGPSIDIFERNTSEPWENIFNLMAKDISKITKDRSSK